MLPAVPFSSKSCRACEAHCLRRCSQACVWTQRHRWMENLHTVSGVSLHWTLQPPKNQAGSGSQRTLAMFLAVTHRVRMSLHGNLSATTCMQVPCQRCL